VHRGVPKTETQTTKKKTVTQSIRSKAVQLGFDGRKPKVVDRPFDRHAALAFARDALTRPPVGPYVVRVEPVGDLVAEFVLPLELCQPQNRKGKAAAWAHDRIQRDLFATMLAQFGGRRREKPLPGRPQVLSIRFSSNQPDKYADWGKVATDRLCVHVERIMKTKRGRKRSPNLKLGIIHDDAPEYADVNQWWEKATQAQGCVYIRVFTGES
jgi:hypothetical protein